MINFPVAIIGLGLVGSSLGLALRKVFEGEIAIVGFDQNPETVNNALKIKSIHYITNNLKVAVEQAEIVFLAVPVLEMISITREIAPYLKKGAVLTDVGSTKEYITEEILKLLPQDVHFVPAHPIAGSEKSGPLAASADLFLGKKYIITTYEGINEEAVNKVKKLIDQMGINEYRMNIKEHDKMISLTSHIPQITSSALITLLAEYDDSDEIKKLIGSGFESTTRIATSNPKMWTEICLTNKDNIVSGIDKLQNILEELKIAILSSDSEKINNYFQKARTVKENIRKT